VAAASRNVHDDGAISPARAGRSALSRANRKEQAMLAKLFGAAATAPAATGDMVIARLNARAQPLDRGEVFEDPLNEVLQASGTGDVTGGGTMLGADGEIAFCDLEIIVPAATDAALAAIRTALERLGAPKGSKMIWNDGADEAEFGTSEGLAVYLNGTDLPDAVYEQCGLDIVYEEFGKLVAGKGRVVSHWQGPRETALYLYGRSADAMLARIRPFLDSYPLCAQARIVKIA
jgi:hypothetical protein